MRTVGIDPGINGAIAIMWESGSIDLLKMPDESDMVDALRCCEVDQDGVPCRVYLEQVSGYIGSPQPGGAMFKFGRSFGFILGVLAALEAEVHLVRPQAWQKGLPGVAAVKGPAKKRAIKDEAARRYPKVKTTLQTADALMIADWGRNR